MKYEKPEIVLEGDATLLIRGQKVGQLIESPGVFRTQPDAELDE